MKVCSTLLLVFNSTLLWWISLSIGMLTPTTQDCYLLPNYQLTGLVSQLTLILTFVSPHTRLCNVCSYLLRKHGPHISKYLNWLIFFIFVLKSHVHKRNKNKSSLWVELISMHIVISNYSHRRMFCFLDLHHGVWFINWNKKDEKVLKHSLLIAFCIKLISIRKFTSYISYLCMC